MRHTILIATLSSVAASILTTAVISGSLFGAHTASSADTGADTSEAIHPGSVDSILQGDINCDGAIDGQDVLGGLYYIGGLDVQQDEPCPDVGTLAAIPGPAGPQGEPGPPGEAGEVGISGFEILWRDTDSNSTSIKSEDMPCPAGKVTLGGGALHFGPVTDVSIASSYPVPSGGEWRATAAEVNPTSDDWALRVYAICANVAE